MALYLDLTVDDAVKKKKTFLYVIGEDARKVYETLTIVNNDNAPIAEKNRTVEQVMTASEAYCNPKKNETVERHKFFTRSQASGETFDEYLTELRTLAAECGFGAIKDSLIRDRILCGISDGKVRERLLRESDLCLKKCGEICCAAEVSLPYRR
ncbi:Hypp7261 [Branchiostoma lanceolatum]|uniref:Hypp7261 protein n=1 Tax=Branchiostoma lanceolatum TaxID=7740 RepID=A0A8J9YZ50_BRALA|nr:Hypp7261 [Branchiostoma lanceolatum]